MKDLLLKSFYFAYFFFGALFAVVMLMSFFISSFEIFLNNFFYNILVLFVMFWWLILGLWIFCALFILITQSKSPLQSLPSKLIFNLLLIVNPGICIFYILYGLLAWTRL